MPDRMAAMLEAKIEVGFSAYGFAVSGEVTDIELGVGDSAALGRIGVTLGACRYPEDNQAGEAFAWVTVTDPRREAPLFEGWMTATSPALNALDHPRYDVWVIRCTNA